MTLQEQQIARRFAALEPGARRAFLDRLREKGLRFADLPVVAAPRTAAMPLSHAQEALWLTWKLDPDSPSYNLAGVLHLRGRLDRPALERAVQALVARHEILRTVYPVDADGRPGQRVLEAPCIAVPLVDLRGEPAATRAATARAQQDAFARTPFRLDTDTPLRTTLWQLDEDVHALGLNLHHIAGDGWSIRILIDELLALYGQASQDVPARLAPLPIQFADHATWQRNWFEAGELERQLAHWRARLEGAPAASGLPPDHPGARTQTPREAHLALRLPAALSARLKALAREHGASLFMVMAALLKLALHRFNGQDELCIGTPVANREKAETHGLIGYLLNMQVLRTRIDTRLGFAAFLEQVRETVLEAQSWPDLPFDVLVQELRPERQPGVHPLFQVKCTQQDDMPDAREAFGLSVRVEALSTGQAHFDLSFDFADRPDGIEASLIYAANLFEERTIAALAACLESFAEQVAAQPARPLACLETPVPSSVLDGGRNAFPAKTVLDLWNDAVQRGPQMPAVRDEARVLDRAGLDARAAHLARRLLAMGLRREDRVGLHAGRSCEFVAGLLAVLKAGGVCVPLDPALPAERLAWQLDDSGAALLLGTDAQALGAPVPVVLLDAAEESSPSDGAALPELHPEQAAYLIYTSGSTGRPKGVEIGHAALANYVQGVLERLGLPDVSNAPDMPDEVQSMAMVSTVAADLGHTVLFGALCSGRLLYLVPADRAFDPDAFADAMRRHRVDVLKIVPSHLQALLHAAEPAAVLPGRCLVLGGEATPWPLADRLAALRPDMKIVNHYGPTETTVGILTQDVGSACRFGAALPLGMPLANARACVLDADLNPVPPGGIGELYLGGPGLARGYRGRAGQTAERFVASPFGDGARLYRTGDRARLLADATLEFLGRVDHQVKIRGYRVELGEVETQLRAHPDVEEAVAAVEDSAGGARLTAWVRGRDGQPIDLAGLKQALARALPDYMVPASIVPVARIPLNANGKVDRAALAALTTLDAAPQEAAWEAPRGETEQALAGLWAELLGVERVGRGDSFFALGGDSIQCLKLVARARKQGLTLLPRQIFEHQTLQAVAQAMVQATGGTAPDAAREAQPIARLDPALRKEPLPLSHAQARQWFLWQLDPDSSAYHIAGALRLRGQLDTEALRASFDALVERHESLRTVFLADASGQAAQRVHPHGRAQIDTIDLGHLPESQRQAGAQEHAQRLAEAPFDLAAGPLLRVGLIRLAPQEHVLVVVMHHIVSDGWSMQVLVDEFVAQYRARVQEGAQPDLPPLPIQYADYAAWQRNWLDAGERARQLAYWTARLGTDHPVLQLPASHARRADGRYRAARHGIELPAELVRGLQERARRQDATLFMVLLAGAQVLLNRYTGQPDIRLGVPVANRTRAETQRVIGFFVNTQVLSGRIGRRDTLAHVLSQARTASLEAQQHQDLPFEQLVEALQPERSLSVNPLFQVMFNHQRGDLRALERLPGLTLEEHALDGQAAQFELGIDTAELSDGRVHVSFAYARELFEPAMIARMGRHYLAVLEALAWRPEQAVGEVALMDTAEQAQLLALGRNDMRYRTDEPVHALIDRQAAETPDATALLCEGQSLSYAQLRARTDALAHALTALGAGTETRIGIALERSLDMAVGVLAVLKAGGTYVPLDPEYPPERLSYMVQDSGVSLILTHAHLRENFAGLSIQAQVLDIACLPTNGDAAAPKPVLHGHNLAYIIYTSGSTGRPKGIGISHAALAEHSRIAVGYFGLSGQDRMLQFSTINFDGFVEQLFPALTCGATVVLRGPQLWDSERFQREAIEQGVTIADLPTAYWHLLAQDFARQGLCSLGRLRQINATGEAMPLEGLKAWHQAGLETVKLLNSYGPTETVVTATAFDCAALPAQQEQEAHSIPIGRPLAGRSLHILGPDLEPVPQGIAGELYIGGELLARGYHGRPGLSSERFIADPCNQHGGRLYRTGDLVRWNENGELQYLGRTDHQVKVRGFRIELGEIEARLLAQQGVREAAVIARETSTGTTLFAYVSAQEGHVLQGSQLRQSLAKDMPDYMIPSSITVLPKLPVNGSGKLDRKALPDVQEEHESDYAAPQGEIESAVAQIWQDVLGIERIGRDDNFFELGGHSLLALNVLSRLRAGLKVDLPLRQLFEQPVLKALSAQVAQKLQTGSAAAQQYALLPVPRTREMALSPNQRRLWMVERLGGAARAGEPPAYNMSSALRLTGRLDAHRLHETLRLLAVRHEVLRTVYPENDEGEPVARIAMDAATEANIAMPVEDVAGVPPHARDDAVLRRFSAFAAEPFDLSTGPLLRAGLLRLDENHHVLMLGAHHIAFDGWSVAIFVREFVEIYRSLGGLDAPDLPRLDIQYADYAHWHSRRLREAEAENAAFWRGYLDGAPAQSVLPPDLRPAGRVSSAGGRVAVEIDAGTAQRMEGLARDGRTSLFTVLFASFLLFLHRRTGADDLVVGTDVAGRDHPELEKLLGFFVNVLPVRSRMEMGSPTFAQWLSRFRERLLTALEHQDVPFDQIVEYAAPAGRRQRNPLVQILFVMQNTPESRFELPGLAIELLPQAADTSKFDLAVFVTQEQGRLVAEWVYAADLYRRETVARLAAEWRDLVSAWTASPDAPVLPLESPSSQETLTMPDQPLAASKLGKLDKLNKLRKPGGNGGLPQSAPSSVLQPASQSSPSFRTSFLSAQRDFPLVIEAAGRDIDPVAWARAHAEFIESSLRRHAGILFRGFALDNPQEFESFAEAIQPDLYGEYGDLPKKEGGRNSYRSTPYPEREMILYHNEASHTGRWPRKQLFYCEIAARAGGATPVVDCREMLRRLPPELVREFERKELLYVRTFTPRLDVSWQDFYKTQDRAEVEARLSAAGVAWRWLDENTLQTGVRCPAVITHPLTGDRVFFNQVQLHHASCLAPDLRADLLEMVGLARMPRHVYYGDGSAISDDTMTIVGRVYEECAVRFAWQRGDVLMVDNMLAAHARDPFEGERKVVVAMGEMYDRAVLDPHDGAGGLPATPSSILHALQE